ncbi:MULTISPECIES: hypothetical protein [unclassified Variovorax]|uniref:hypothetical protein n=1 Tax=unclassified Variovorax TaxID=663243 RepID=UPI00117D4344|nr:hypothetical protein [Variovorax sp. YR752]
MKVSALPVPAPIRNACPRCNTIVRSNAPLVLPRRKRIVIEIFESPGTGNVVNAKNIWNALRHRYTVHVQVSGNHDVVAKIFSEGYVAAEVGGDYDLLIVPGIEIRLRHFNSQLRKVPALVMNLPPPFCKHLFVGPFLRRNQVETSLLLDHALPFQPHTENWKQIEKAQDYKGLKARYFPTVDKSAVFFLVTYIGLAPKKTDAFKNCEECIIILNFGTHALEVTEGKNVVSHKCDRLPMVEFEKCLLQCTTIFPIITDGGNTVGTIQSLELPYYDVSMKRVMECPTVAFLNDGFLCNMDLFRKLGSREKNKSEFQIVELRTQAYYDTNRPVRQLGRGAAVLFLVGQAFK